MQHRQQDCRSRGRHRAGTAARDGRELALWALGLLCGLGAAAASEAFLLPFSLVLALAGGLPLAWLGLRWLLRPRRPVVVWEGLSWRMP